MKEHCWVRKNIIFYLLSKVSFLKNTFGIWSMVNSSLATTSSIIVYPKSKSNMFEASIAETIEAYVKRLFVPVVVASYQCGHKQWGRP